MKYKKCRKCGRVLPATIFNKRTDLKDGLQSYCRPCQHGYAVEHNEVSAEEMHIIDSHFEVKFLPNGVRYYHWKGC